jgi:hypothetical protein
MPIVETKKHRRILKWIDSHLKNEIQKMIDNFSILAIYRYVKSKYSGKYVISYNVVAKYVRNLKNQIENEKNLNSKLLKNKQIEKSENEISEQSINDKINELFNKLQEFENSNILVKSTKIEMLNSLIKDTWVLLKILQVKMKENFTPAYINSYKGLAELLKNLSETLGKFSGELSDNKVTINIMMPMLDRLIKIFYQAIIQYAPDKVELIKQFLKDEIMRQNIPGIVNDSELSVKCG